jgi:hypothetical protein
LLSADISKFGTKAGFSGMNDGDPMNDEWVKLHRRNSSRIRVATGATSHHENEPLGFHAEAISQNDGNGGCSDGRWACDVS